jgi:RHS repeat-associated protein
MLKRLLCLILVVFSLRAEDPTDDLFAIPSNLVSGSISAITGEWIISDIDASLPGPEPLVLQRQYSPNKSLSNSYLQTSWDFNLPPRIRCELPKGGKDNIYKVHVAFSSGSRLVLEGEGTPHTPIIFTLCKWKGITNCGSNELSARTNLNNVTVQSDDNRQCFTLTSGNGGVRFFGKDKGHIPFYYKQQWEQKPNGNFILTKEDRVLATNSTKNVVYSWVEFLPPSVEDFKKNPRFFLKTSSGKTVGYVFKRIGAETEEEVNSISDLKNYYLKTVYRSDAPQEEYIYDCEMPASNHPRNHFLARRQRPKDHFLEVEYYHQGENDLYGLPCFKIYPDSHPLINRVRIVKAPVGPDSTPIITHRFLYDIVIKKHSNGSREVLSGTTDVLDAYLRKKTYFYDQDHRLTCLRTFSGTYPHYSVHKNEHFIWNKKGNLLATYVQEGQETLHQARRFNYDKKGNLTVQRVYGNLSGFSTIPIRIDKDKLPLDNGTECYTKRYAYSQDKFNLLLVETEDNGKKILYDYLPHTDLLTAKLLLDNDVICLRHFFSYDANTSLVKTIEDDGCTNDPHNLSGVTERLITYFFPRQTEPVGLPERIDKMYLDLQTGQETLLKRLFCFYSKEGHLIRQDTYDAQGVFCYTQEWNYDDHGNVIFEKDPIGRVITREFDENDNLIRENGPSLNLSTLYTYDYSDRLIKKEEVHASGHRFVTCHTYDYLGNKTSTVDRFGNQTFYHYNFQGRLVATVHPKVMDENGSETYPTTRTAYDVFDRPTVQIDAKGKATYYAYNLYGKPTGIVYPDGTKENFLYTLDGTLSKSVATNGTHTLYTHDALGRKTMASTFSQDGRLLKQESFAYKGRHLIAHCNPEGILTEYKYDGAGRLMSKQCEENLQSFSYDTLGRLSQVKEWYGYAPHAYTLKTLTYDFLDRILCEQVMDASGNVLKSIFYEYDLAGNRTRAAQKTTEGIAVSYIEYNGDNQPVKLVDAEGNATIITYHYDRRDAFGQRILHKEITDPNGCITVEIYDAMNRLVQILKSNGLGLLLFRQDLVYDSCGNKVKQADYALADGQLLRASLTVWTYATTGQLVCQAEAVGLPEQKHTCFQYNAFGQQSAIYRTDGTALLKTYDELGRLSTVTSTDQTLGYLYEYNKNNQVIRATDLIHRSVTARTYDSMGRMRQEIAGNGFIVNFDYDRSNRLSNVQFPDDSSVQYVYDAAYLKEIHRRKNGKLLYSHLEQTHDLAGRTKEIKLINGLTCRYDHDLIGRVRGITSSIWAEHIPPDGYDRKGNLVHSLFADRIGLQHCHFSYNGLHQLIAEQSFVSHTYSCDSLDNRLSKDQVSYAINPLNQVLQQGTCSYLYDARGNLIRKTQGNQVKDYTYDAWDRLIALFDGKHHISYTYDCFNRRLSQTVDGKTTLFAYLEQKEIGSIDKDSAQWNEFRIIHPLYKSETGASIAIEMDGEAFAPMHDHNGNVVCLVDKEGEAFEIYRFNAFGEERIFDAQGKSKEAKNPWRFAGKRKDRETALIYFGMRYYDSEVGRWTTRDPLEFEDGPNLYAYLHHNPLNKIDAFGLLGEAYRESQQAAMNASNYPLTNIETKNESFVPCEFNQEKKSWYEYIFGSYTSCMYDLGNAEPKNCRITYQHGIWNFLSTSFESAMTISHMAGGYNVHFCHHPTMGLLDFVRCFLELMLGFNTSAVKELQNDWIEFLKNNPLAFILHICHSEGAIVTRNALRSLPEEFRAKIHVEAFAPGGYISDKLAASVHHYRSTRDIVPLLDFKGALECKDSTTVLKPHSDAPWFDHSFDSPTFEGALRYEIERFLSSNGN